MSYAQLSVETAFVFSDEIFNSPPHLAFAFVGRLNPVGIFFASLLMALLYIGGEQAQQYMNLPSSISKVFQGMLLFFLLGSDVFIQYRLKRTGAAR